MSQGEKKVFNVSFFSWLGQKKTCISPLHPHVCAPPTSFARKKNKSRLTKWA